MTDGERIEEAVNTVRRWRAQLEGHEKRLAELGVHRIECTIGRELILDRELDALNSRLAEAHGYELVRNDDGTISLRKSEATLGITLHNLNVDSVNQRVAFSASGDGFKVVEFSLPMKIDRTDALRDLESSAKLKAAGILERIAAEMRRLADED